MKVPENTNDGFEDQVIQPIDWDTIVNQYEANLSDDEETISTAGVHHLQCPLYPHLLHQPTVQCRERLDHRGTKVVQKTGHHPNQSK